MENQLVICDPRDHLWRQISYEVSGFLKQDVSECSRCHLIIRTLAKSR
jgi:hypothetical protein